MKSLRCPIWLADHTEWAPISQNTGKSSLTDASCFVVVDPLADFVRTIVYWLGIVFVSGLPRAQAWSHKRVLLQEWVQWTRKGRHPEIWRKGERLPRYSLNCDSVKQYFPFSPIYVIFKRGTFDWRHLSWAVIPPTAISHSGLFHRLNRQPLFG